MPKHHLKHHLYNAHFLVDLNHAILLGNQDLIDAAIMWTTLVAIAASAPEDEPPLEDDTTGAADAGAE